MSMVLAGLATGLGQGIQKQAEFNMQRDEAQRDRDFQSALENLRTQNNIAVDNNRADRGDQSTKMEYGLKDEFEERDAPRKVKVATEIAKAEGKVRIDVDAAATTNDIRRIQVQGAIARQNDAASQKLANQLESGQIVDTLLDESGEYVGITRNGQQVRTNVFAHTIDTTFRPTAGGMGGGLFDDPALQGLGGPTQAAPAPAAARSQPPAAVPARSGGGMYFAKTDAQAEAFANNPANKGKSFVGPDGKQYTVQ